MNLIIDCVSLHKGGVEQVAVSFLRECRAISSNIYHVFLRDNIKNQLELSDFKENFIFYDFSERPGEGLFSYFRVINRFKRLAERIDPDCVLYTSGQGYWLPGVPVVFGFNMPHYIYPESPYFIKIGIRRKIYWLIKKTIDLYFYKRAAAITVQTDDVRTRLQSLVGNVPVYILSNAVNGCFFEGKAVSAKLSENKNNEKRLLMVSSYYPHKNIEIISDVIHEFVRRNFFEVKFVLTLPNEIFQAMFDEQVKGFIHNVGPIPISECPSLYNECDFMFLPTLLECFSASYVEAMASELPILTSDLGFAHCVCADTAEYFDPMDPVAIADTIVNLCSNSDRQTELIQKGSERLMRFPGADSRADRLLSICEELVSNNS